MNVTEGFEHLIQTHRVAGAPVLVTSNTPRAWGYTLADSTQSTNRLTVVYMIMDTAPDDHGRVLARRWGYQDETGHQTAAPGLMVTPIKVSNFDLIKGW